MRQPAPHAALRRLDPLVGQWRMWALSGGDRVGPVRTTFEWWEVGAFLVQRSDIEPDAFVPAAWRATMPFPVTAVIGLDETSGEFSMLYADGRAVARVYRMTLDAGVWRIWRAAEGFHQRFTATFSDGGDTVTGGWEGSRDGAAWGPDFGVSYVRVR